jgi:hypothetical protein
VLVFASIHDSDLAALHAVNSGGPTTFLREKKRAGSGATGAEEKTSLRGTHAYGVHRGTESVARLP